MDALEEQLGDERRKVDVANHNFSARELVRMMADGELNIAPAYQRKFRWTEQGESIFIESIFLGLPIPPLFVATNVGFQWEIVDGLQRLSTLMHFMATNYDELGIINRDRTLVLQGLEKLTQLNGRVFDDLSVTLKRYFSRQPLQVVSLTDKSNLQIRFDLFERLNKGAVALSPQEVRACVYWGDFNQFLESLSEEDTFASLLKLQELRQNDGTRAEQVLKFFAYKNAREDFDGRVEKFLNRYMEIASGDFDFEAERDAFRRASTRLSEICDGGPYLRGGFAITPLVQFEACFVAVAELQAEGRDVPTPPDRWSEDAELRDSSTGGTNTRSMLRRRIKRAKELLSGDA